MPSSDRLRTSVNIAGDGFGAGIVAHLCRGLLRKQSQAALALSSASSPQLDRTLMSESDFQNNNRGFGGGHPATALPNSESYASGLGMLRAQ